MRFRSTHRLWAVSSLALAAAALCGFAEEARAGLNIVPTFDSSITSDPNAADIETGINNAIAQLESHITNNVTVNITFAADESIGLGQSSTFYGGLSYQQYQGDLLTKQTLSTNDVTAIASLPNQATNPVNGSGSMSLTLPLLRALGEQPAPSGPDSTISLKTSIMNFLRTGPQDPDKYDLQETAAHEITEVLGAGGAGSNLGQGGTDIGSLDLFRYSAPGTRSYSTSAKSSYFSIDGGATRLSFFNQTNGGDYADWDGDANGSPQVQDAFGLPGTQLNLDSTEVTALDIVGWNVQVPEPASLGLLAAGAVMLLRWRKAR